MFRVVSIGKDICGVDEVTPSWKNTWEVEGSLVSQEMMVWTLDTWPG